MPVIETISRPTSHQECECKWGEEAPTTTHTVVQAATDDWREETQRTNQQILLNNEHTWLIICE